MIPSVIAGQVRQGIAEYLETTFPVSTPLFEGMLARFLDDGHGVFKGPFVSVRLPFRGGGKEWGGFGWLPQGFAPYAHQRRAFARLAAGRSTVVATGTGSGKTESFLYPILDDCLARRGEQGIKAIIVYPMNALANDQSRRLARLIHASEALRGAVRVGMYVGERDAQAALAMEEERVITNRETMRLAPPDILLTNYKMLDYLLIRAQDHGLWRENGPDTLRHLVVDELHTFDGAQGTDLACLVRRLKARLGTPPGRLCCVATSATIGGAAQVEELRAYASTVFGEEFDAESIITEETLTADAFFAESEVRHPALPDAPDGDLDALRAEDLEGYGRLQARVWFGEALDAGTALPELLLSHVFFRQMIRALEQGPRPISDLRAALARALPEYAALTLRRQELLLDSMLALVALARVQVDGRLRPFLWSRLQLWQRELSRLVASVSHEPALAFSSDLREEQLRTHLPLVHCRECGVMGWSGVVASHQQHVQGDLATFYSAYFNYSASIAYLMPLGAADRDLPADVVRMRVCGRCLTLEPGEGEGACAVCRESATMIPVAYAQPRVKSGERYVGSHDCPFCRGVNSLAIVGSRAASLVSVAIGQLFSSRFTPHKKLLAFSDSVQDASHRAGFFGARTYRLTLRSAMQQALLAVGGTVPLGELPQRVCDYWRARMDVPAFIATFLPPDLEWLEEYEQLLETGSADADGELMRLVAERMDWEVWAEYGYNCRIGRTLEKTGASIASVVDARIEAAADLLLEPLRNECGGLRELDRARLVVFLHGVVTQLKNKGGIAHPALEVYIEDRGKTFRFNKRRALPVLTRDMRTPMFVADRRGTAFDTLTSEVRRMTWYEQWAAKCFGDIDLMIDAEVRDLYRLVMRMLVANGVLFARTVHGYVVWGIDAAALEVGAEVTQMRCEGCGHQISVATRHVAIWEGAPCLRFSCRGRHAAAERREDYYRSLYTVGEVRRIFAREHTGMLPRAQRESLEGAFIAGDRAGAPNLLSCTPTLEMGIDIGDLSSVVLCSVPPTQANYLQRIGRSGRASGAAFTYTIATSRPHDLYFHAQPEEMLAGGVDTPGCFLNAPAVLERQLMAYCFDRWMVATQGTAVVPKQLGQVLAAVGSAGAGDRFPHTFIGFITDHREALVDGFLAMFGDALTSETCASLQQHVLGSPDGARHLTYTLLDALTQLVREQDDLRRRVRRLTTVMRELRARPVRDAQHDEELDMLEMEKAALVGIIERIRNKDTLNFFTDEGLLPNYAFPEAGVVLRSILYRKQEAGDGSMKYRTRTYEYERPASSAIHEFAFENTFYADGRRVTIDRVNMGLSELEEWQFCSVCSYHEQASSTTAPTCPRCGNELWSDDAYRRRMLRIRQVEAVTSERKSRSHDESDDRAPRFFNRRMMVVYDRTRIARTFALETPALPFGFEYMTRATFREINFGEKGRSGETLHIAGMDVLKSAFTLCRDCGKVQREGAPPEHAGTCRHARSGAGSSGSASEAARIECVFLYREFDSEAIRILLPATTFSTSSVTFHTFVGSLYLGLRRRFRGRIDHLRTMVDEEPAEDGGTGRRYLLLYDTVPGGTGYLKELMGDPASFMEVFALALDVLRSCGCRADAERDGCYRCIYSYRYSDEMAEMSRALGVELMQEIVQHRDSLRETDSLSTISFNSLLESELERLFIEAFRHVSPPDVQMRIAPEIVRGRSGWSLSVGERDYLIEPQVELGPREGVAVACRADFVVHPARSMPGVLPVAVFTDGFAYHADAAHDRMRVGHDMAQRMALVASGRYRVWSLTWEDVHVVFGRRTRTDLSFAGRHRARLLPLLDAYDGDFRVKGLSHAHEAGAFALLVHLLAHPDERMWKMHALLQVLALVTHRVDASTAASLLDAVRCFTSAEPLPMPEAASDGSVMVGLDVLEDDDGEAFCRMCATIPVSALTQRKLLEARLVCRLHDEDAMALRPGFAQVWNGFLQWYNLLQFAPHVECVTTRGCADGAYAFLAGERERQLRVRDDVLAGEVREQLALVHVSARELVVALLAAGVPMPVVGHELCADSGTVLAGAELAWEAHRVAVLLGDTEADRTVYVGRGWTVFGVEEEDVAGRVAAVCGAGADGDGRRPGE